MGNIKRPNSLQLGQITNDINEMFKGMGKANKTARQIAEVLSERHGFYVSVSTVDTILHLSNIETKHARKKLTPAVLAEQPPADTQEGTSICESHSYEHGNCLSESHNYEEGPLKSTAFPTGPVETIDAFKFSLDSDAILLSHQEKLKDPQYLRSHLQLLADSIVFTLLSAIPPAIDITRLETLEAGFAETQQAMDSHQVGISKVTDKINSIDNRLERISLMNINARLEKLEMLEQQIGRVSFQNARLEHLELRVLPEVHAKVEAAVERIEEYITKPAA